MRREGRLPVWCVGNLGMLADVVVRLRPVLSKAKEEERTAFARLEQLYASTEARKDSPGGPADSTMRNPALS